MAQPAPEDRGPAEASPATLDELRAEFAALLDHVARIRTAVGALNDRQRDVEILMLAFDERSDRFAARLAASAPETVAETATVAPVPADPVEEAAFREALAPEPAGQDAPQPGPHDAEAAQHTGEDDQVPTVSDVVSRLGRSEDATKLPDAAAAETYSPSAVELLGAMVERLAAAMPAASPAAAACAAPPAREPLEELLPEADMDLMWVDPEPEPNAAGPVLKDAPDDPSGPAPAEGYAEPPFDLPPSPDSADEKPGPEPAARPVMPELDLLTNFARTDAAPHMPPEIGTAVIFGPRQPDDPEATGQATAVEPEAVAAAVAGAAVAAAPATPAEVEDLLFEQTADADPDPAAALLGPPEPEPSPQPTAGPLRADAAEAEADATASDTAATSSTETETGSHQPQPNPAAPPRPDPLAPLKAMSDAERIALFE